MRLGAVTKLDKKTQNYVKKFDDNVMLENCDAIVIFLTYGQFGAIHNLDFRRRVCKSYVFKNSNLLFYKNWKQN